MADFSFEVQYGYPKRTIAGVDEVGRGCLAGPVVAAAVILPKPWASALPEWATAITDSKALKPSQREDLDRRLRESAIEFEIAESSVTEIDRINIYHAAHLAMKRSVERLSKRVHLDHLLIDGNAIPKGLLLPASPIVKGDLKSLSIAAASILAKVTRDRMMTELEVHYPGYGLSVHKGYPTPFHKDALIKLGITPLHRRSFGPVRALIGVEGRSNEVSEKINRDQNPETAAEINTETSIGTLPLW